MVGGHHLLVDVGFDRDHAGAVTLYGEFVEPQLRVGLLGIVACGFDHRAGLGGEASCRYLFEDQVQPGARGAGQEPEVPGIDAHDGDRGAAEAVYAFEQCAVAAVTDH